MDAEPPETDQTGATGSWQASPTQEASPWFPLRGDSASPVPGLQGHQDIILLSFFDGVGSAAVALSSMGLRIRAILDWEVDPAALAVSAEAYKGLRFKRGDITQDDPEDISRILQQLLQDHPSRVLVTAGPPCPDFSTINASAQGKDGSSGHLFVVFVRFLQAIERTMGAQFPLLVENVFMQNSTDVEWFSKELQATPIAADASAFGMISRHACGGRG